MLEKVKAKAKEIASNEDVQFAVGIGSIMLLGFTGIYFVGYASGISAGVDGAGRAIVGIFEDLAKIAEKAA